MNRIFTAIIILFCCLTLLSESSYDLEELAKLFEIDAQFAIQHDFYSYQASRKGEAVIKYMGTNRNTDQSVLIISEANIYSLCYERIDRYIEDIEYNLQYTTIFYTVTKAVSPQDIKAIITDHYQNDNIEGTVLIGDVSTAWYEIQNDFNMYGYAVFPIDLYYMDLNGTWLDTNGNGRYNSHQGHVSPEIYVGRINTSTMFSAGSEELLLNVYLDRNHAYWQGNIDLNNRVGLSYTDYDWTQWSDFRHDVQYIYGSSSYEWYIYGDGTFSRSDYLNRLGMEQYGMVQFSCHSGWDAHYLHNQPLIYTHTIFNIPPASLSYNLFNCSGARWTAPTAGDFGYLGGVYVYNHGSDALFAVGSAKTGSMLGFSYYYIPLGNGKTNGQAFKDWWVNFVGPAPTFNDICWFYGMTIVGDPMVKLFYEPNAAVSAPSGLQANTASLSEVNLSWIDNSNNELGFRIERKTGAGGNWSQIAETGADITSFHDAGLSPYTTYFYRVRAFNSMGDSNYSNEASADTDGKVIVYRFFNNVRGGHLYTISEYERDYVLQLADWNYEGSQFRVYYTQLQGSTPAYRFFNTVTGIHLYTISEYERDYVMQFPEWNYEDIKFYAHEGQVTDTIPVYRFFNHVRGGHLYTISEYERDYVMQLPDWTFEGIPFYVFPL